ncbi:Transposon Ty3-G Gag-Pol polyprotein [Penaeus vannamei]|uniref:Transposon Ty3-G Gag-Pol polyprotein n=1 Tax=Penaeus vannamei TaxID=6689 RepID=A0A423T761_PENVA|nr:Transposon Ty3-G Gag-Pol polyprotein [Penaeus vannamei]
MPVVQVLYALQQYFRNSQNEALRRRELLSCKQTPGPASAIVAAPSQLNILSSYKRNQRRQKMTATTKHTPQRCQSPPLTKDSPASCRSCTRQHAVGHCPAKDSTCPNCGYKGHWHRTPRCPAKDSECTTCHKQGHFAKCCKSTRKTSTNQTRRARRVSTGRTPKPVNVTLSYGSKSSQLLMLPDTGADITVIGPKHLDSLGIPRCNLSPPPATDVLTADGSSMTPALGCFETTLQLGQASCKAIVHVHEDIQTPLLSYSHCVDLAIVSTDFPKPILSVTHVNRCAQQMPASAMSSPTTARTYFLQHFSDVLVSKTDLQTTPLKKMSGPPMRIHLQPGATPFAIHTPRPIPFAYRDQVKEELDSLVQQGIISPVGDKPSEWCHPMVLVPKPGNGVRITVDLTRLNSQVSRPTHPSPTPADAIRTITPSAKFFTRQMHCMDIGKWTLRRKTVTSRRS